MKTKEGVSIVRIEKRGQSESIEEYENRVRESFLDKKCILLQVLAEYPAVDNIETIEFGRISKGNLSDTHIDVVGYYTTKLIIKKSIYR